MGSFAREDSERSVPKFPFSPGKDFDIIFLCTEDRFKVFIFLVYHILFVLFYLILEVILTVNYYVNCNQFNFYCQIAVNGEHFVDFKYQTKRFEEHPKD